MSDPIPSEQQENKKLEDVICDGTLDGLISVLKIFSNSGYGKKQIRINGWGSDEGLGPFAVKEIKI